ncbi:transferase [Aureococcus anophagefferens]|nr:transferase [Aureococcus anophagefferens]
MKINRKFFAAALGLSTDAVETVANCGDGRRRRLLAANATNATAAPTPMGCSDVRADITMFDYQIDAYLASLGRRLATYDHLGDTAAMIQARIEEYYGLNETSEATEACGGLSVDVAVVYYPTPDPTPAPTDDVDDEIDTASLELPIWLLVVVLLTIAGILALPLAFMIDRYRSKHPVALTKGDRKALPARPDDIAVVDRSDIAVYADGEDDDVEAARRFPELTERDDDGPVESSRKSLKAKVAGLFGPGKAKVYLYTDGESRVKDEEATDADETAAPIVEVFPELTEPKERDGYAPRMVKPKSSKAKVAGLFGPGMAKVYIDGESRVEAKGVDEEVKDADETAAPIVEVFPELTEPKERDGYAPRMVKPKSSKAKVAGLFGPGMAKVYIDGESRVEAKGVDEEVKDADEAAAPIVEVFPELTEPKERDGPYAPRTVKPKSSKAKVAGLFGPGMAKVYIDGESRVEAKEEVKDAEAAVADEAAAPRAAPDGGLVEVSFHGAPFDFSPVLAKRDDGGLAVRCKNLGWVQRGVMS